MSGAALQAGSGPQNAAGPAPALAPLATRAPGRGRSGPTPGLEGAVSSRLQLPSVLPCVGPYSGLEAACRRHVGRTGGAAVSWPSAGRRLPPRPLFHALPGQGGRLTQGFGS
jgi:hypothetical protein